MDICLRNIPKSNPYLILESTPNRPNDLMFKKMSLDYTYGISKIQLQYADGIDSSSTICINGKCVTKVCPENEPCITLGDNSTSRLQRQFY